MSYKAILARADGFFRSVMQAQPQNLQCGKGCSLCCYGLFEIGSGDVPLIAEGLEKLHPARRTRQAKSRLGQRPGAQSQDANEAQCSGIRDCGLASLRAVRSWLRFRLAILRTSWFKLRSKAVSATRIFSDRPFADSAEYNATAFCDGAGKHADRLCRLAVHFSRHRYSRPVVKRHSGAL